MKESHKILSIVCLFIVVVSIAGYVGVDSSNEDDLVDDNAYIDLHYDNDNPCYKGGLINKKCGEMISGR